ncbi:hypothetical protein LXL04_006598 [Taraxacum kok-saghyz]
MRDSESKSEPSCVVSKGIEKHTTESSAKPTKLFDNNKGQRSNKICIYFRKNNNSKHGDIVPEENNSSMPIDNIVPSEATDQKESL